MFIFGSNPVNREKTLLSLKPPMITQLQVYKHEFRSYFLYAKSYYHADVTEHHVRGITKTD
jgi:hypothetical protein